MTNNMSTRRIHQPVTSLLCGVVYRYINAIGFYNTRWRRRQVIPLIISPFIRPALPQEIALRYRKTRVTPASTSLPTLPIVRSHFLFSIPAHMHYIAPHTPASPAVRAALSTLTRHNAEICLSLSTCVSLKGLVKGRRIYLVFLSFWENSKPINFHKLKGFLGAGRSSVWTFLV